MKLIAKKPCSFAGKKFYIDDEIPVECVADPRAQEKRGVLVVLTNDDVLEVPVKEVYVEKPVAIVLHTENGDVVINPTPQGLQTVFDVLTSNVDNAEPIVKQMTEDDALRLVFAADSRKSIQGAAKARAQELASANTVEEAGEQ